jgi:hypothetical protein
MIELLPPVSKQPRVSTVISEKTNIPGPSWCSLIINVGLGVGQGMLIGSLLSN